jgi:hypothetical protein
LAALGGFALSRPGGLTIPNLKEYGFVNEGHLKMPGSVAAGSDPAAPLAKDPAKNGEEPGDRPPLPPQPGFIEIPIPLQGGGRAYLKIPENYKPEDCDRIAKFVEALK